MLNPLQDVKRINLCPPSAIVDNASFTTAIIDTSGFNYLVVEFQLGASDIAMSALKLQESDTLTDADTLASAADITGMVYGTSTNIAGSTSALPSATDDNKIYSFQLDLKGRKKYIDLVATAGNGSLGTYGAAKAYLCNATNAPRTASECGCGDILRG